jgi:hypothetical protein
MTKCKCNSCCDTKKDYCKICFPEPTKVYDGDISNDTQVTAFATGGYNVINGSLNLSTGITSLSGLSKLRLINGDLNISTGSPLTTLVGLSCLRAIMGRVEINNSNLTNLDGPSCLTTITTLVIINNGALKNIDGLSSITNVNLIRIRNNDMLSNINGLSCITSSVKLIITGNNNITNLNGLISFTTVDELVITGNEILNDFCGLYKVVNVGGYGTYDVQLGNATPVPPSTITPCKCTDLINDLLTKLIGLNISSKCDTQLKKKLLKAYSAMKDCNNKEKACKELCCFISLVQNNCCEVPANTARDLVSDVKVIKKCIGCC